MKEAHGELHNTFFERAMTPGVRVILGLLAAGLVFVGQSEDAHLRRRPRDAEFALRRIGGRHRGEFP